MRLSALALVAALPLAAASQTHLADSTGGYVALHELSFGHSGSGWTRALDGTLGYRFSDRVDAGLRLGHVSGSLGRSWRVAPTAGYTRRLGAGALARVEGTLAYQTYSWTELESSELPDGTSGFERSQPYGARSLSGDVAATVSRPVRLVGSLRVHPTLGVYAAASQAFDRRYPARIGDLGPSALRGSAGVQVGLPLSFRLFGQDVSVAPTARFSLVGNLGRLPDTYGGGGLRLNF